MDTENVGLEGRFYVKKIVDPNGKHEECRYFVLDPQHDPIARRALMTYALDARIAGHGALSEDLFTWLDSLSEEN